MAVQTPAEAVGVLSDLLGEAPIPLIRLLREGGVTLPSGWFRSDPSQAPASGGDGRLWLWAGDDSDDVGGYGNPDSFDLRALMPDEKSKDAIYRAPEHVLGAGKCPKVADLYRRHSVDLTMRGGTTSGVVYPLAVCEIARKFRVRNVGGASAGAIAAAATAAAELARSDPRAVDEPRQQEPTPEAVSPGYVGLAQLVGWLAQLERRGGAAVDKEQDEYRLAQLFHPDTEDRRVFRIAVAYWRNTWALPFVLFRAFGWVSQTLMLLAVLGLAITAGWLGSSTWPSGGWSPAAKYRSMGEAGWEVLTWTLWGFVDLLVLLAGAIAIRALIAAGVRMVRRQGGEDARDPEWLRTLRDEATSAPPSQDGPSLRRPIPPQSAAWMLPIVWLVGLGVSAWVLGWEVLGALLAGSLLVVLAGTILALSVWRYVATGRSRHYGLVSGSTAMPQDEHRSLFDRLAGVPKRTVAEPVVPWLDQRFRELADLEPGRTLCFGHLWLGRWFRPIPTIAPVGEEERAYWEDRRDSARAAEDDPASRLINLELMTADLSRQLPYRFPLKSRTARTGHSPDGSEDLYFRAEDLGYSDDGDDATPLLPRDVVKYMMELDPEPKTAVRTLRGDEAGDPMTSGGVTLYRLPDPWNLPVIFAVRISMSLPGVFKAIRLYRMVPRSGIHDDLGRALSPQRDPLITWPDGGELAEELWFSDGGITSNFPVHFFDALLPAWPTFGLNLGPHPHAYPHQDVWLPQDWEDTSMPASGFGDSALGFLGRIVGTARSWRDTMQTALPGYRGRVAWVRQRPDEGGTNLFMPSAVVASMALRGALAGARLSRRFQDDGSWRRHRWIRLIVALRNLEDQHRAVKDNHYTILDLIQGADWLDTAAKEFRYDPYREDDEAPWFDPGENGADVPLGERLRLRKKFLSDVESQLQAFLIASLPNVENHPDPMPEMRQIPPT